MPAGFDTAQEALSDLLGEPAPLSAPRRFDMRIHSRARRKPVTLTDYHRQQQREENRFVRDAIRFGFCATTKEARQP